MSKDNIRSVVVDDVDLMRATLKKVLANFKNIEIVGEASDYESAREIINNTKPDLVFLDIDLNGITSIDLLNELTCSPKIIFVTSFTNFAVKAFEVNAVDYIVKPISPDRIKKAIEKVMALSDKKLQVSETSNTQPGPATVADLNDNNSEIFKPDQIILLNFDGKMTFIKVSDINYIDAFGNYTKVYMNDGRLSITYNSIKNWEAKLPKEIFIQIHRSTIVNIQNIQKIEKWSNDTGKLFLKNVPEPLDISRSHFFSIKKRFKI
ncbi:MAG: LytR/AlgR family response regulator transcription factor [Bacteroidia bacterium]